MKPLKDLFLPEAAYSVSLRPVYKSLLTGEAVNKKLCDKVLSLTHVILEFYTKQPGSSPSILVNGSEKPSIHSQKSVLRLNEAAVKEY